jgi:pyrimidine-nucleoside phosphorylase
MTLPDIIRRRRDGSGNSAEELRHIAEVAAADRAEHDAQLAAWLMAAFFQPLNLEETVHLTKAMATSGETIDLTGLPRPWIDKHSTGGVGDKTTLVLLPLLAACGLTMVKMSGPGLGKTGGTVDKLGSIPGFRTMLEPNEMRENARRIGIGFSGQSPRLAPADKRLYALRDVTATVESAPLIAASILSKKLAGGAEGVVFDVKVGRGAFMADLGAARELAELLRRVGEGAGLQVSTVITDMEEPLGNSAGNALEVAEARAYLAGEPLSGGGKRFDQVVRAIAAEALRLAGHVAPETMLEEALASGRAHETFEAWLRAHGADLDAELPRAAIIEAVRAHQEGYVESVDADTVGHVVVQMGGGRVHPGDTVDPAVGVVLRRCVGEPVRAGDVLAEIHAQDAAAAQSAKKRLEAGITLAASPVSPRPAHLETHSPAQ